MSTLRTRSRSRKAQSPSSRRIQSIHISPERSPSPASSPATPTTPKRKIKTLTNSQQQKSSNGSSRRLTRASEQLEKSVVSTPSSSGGAPSDLLVNQDPNVKWRSAYVRTYTTILMLGGFVGLFLLGHIPLMFLVFIVQTMMFKELKRLSKVLSTQTSLPSFRPLHWYWFFIAIFFSYGRVLDQYFDFTVPYHSFITFLLYSTGVCLFVMSLEKNYYKYQFEMFAWIHLTLLMVVVQPTVIVVNMFQGLIWFILPALLIVSNDTWAYIFGFFFGRTPLIQLSPKKTWEGFIGAFCMTLFTGFFLPRVLEQYELMVCPKFDLSFEHPSCTPAFPYVLQQYQIHPNILQLLQTFYIDWSYILISPMQWHGLILALFASIVAPFGGFFASGFKRAFKIKDFGESIPGHGGVTDRMDCQILMGLFAFVYYMSFVKETLDTNHLMNLFKQFSPESQVQLYQQIQQYLLQHNLIYQSIP